MTPHPLVTQLRFTRSEFLRGVKNVKDEDGLVRLPPMNCISWNVGHLAWQEQRYFLHFAQGQMPYPEINKTFAYGAPASTPSLAEMIGVWQDINHYADPWLNKQTIESLLGFVVKDGKQTETTYGNLLQRVIYHYWYHNGENQAIRQMLGHSKLPVFVGNIDRYAPYRMESASSE